MGYFFGPRLLTIENVSLDGLQPENAILRARFGDLGLINGEWSVVGKAPHWERSKWPMPDFVRREEFCNRAWRVRYSDDDPNEVVAEQLTDFASDLAKDALLGYGSVEIRLTRLLGGLT